MPSPLHESDHDRLFRYVQRVFFRSGRTKFPTVRDAARALRWRYSEVTAAVEGDPDTRMFFRGGDNDSGAQRIEVEAV